MMAYSLRRFSKWYIQYKTNLFQWIQNISTVLCPNECHQSIFQQNIQKVYRIALQYCGYDGKCHHQCPKVVELCFVTIFQAFLFPPSYNWCFTKVWDQVLERYICYKAVANRFCVNFYQTNGFIMLY